MKLCDTYNVSTYSLILNGESVFSEFPNIWSYHYLNMYVTLFLFPISLYNV